MSKVVWYGERGVVNAMVTALRAREVAAGPRAFLEAIQWGDGREHPWIKIVQEVTFIVEISLHEFGDPDLIIVCRPATSPPYVVIVEAKVVSYLDSAMPNNPGMENKTKGFNSSINGQLALKHRLIQALHRWNGPSSILAEPEGLHAAYVRPSQFGGVGDACSRPRHLVRPRVLTMLREHGLDGLPLEHYYLVAMTWDSEPFWKIPFVGQNDLLPRLLRELPDGGDAFEEMRHRLGWIGYAALERLGLGEEYRRALSTMVKQVAPSPKACLSPDPNLPRITPINRERFQAPTLELLSNLEEAAERNLGAEAVVRTPGSTSVSFDKVLVKLIPQDPGVEEGVVLGISSYLSPQEWCDSPLEGPVVFRGQPFFVVRLKPAPGQEAITIADAIFGQLAERLGLRAD